MTLIVAASKGGVETRFGAKSREKREKPLGAHARAFEAEWMHRRTGLVCALSSERCDEDGG